MIRRVCQNEMHRRAIGASLAVMPLPFYVTVGEPPRSAAQNRRYWGRGVLSQVAEQARSNGQQYTAEAWHEVFKQMFLGVVELPNGKVVGKSSTGLSKAKFSEFCSQVEAFAATELGVFFVDLVDE